MASKLPYNSLPNLGELQSGDIVPMLRPPFHEGSATVSDVQNYIKPYKVYVALLSQSGTDDPTAIVLENTIGEIAWTRDSVGTYFGTLNDAFVENKTWLSITNAQIGEQYYYEIERGSENFVYIQTRNSTYTLSDYLLGNTSIEIRVYNSEPA